MNIQAKSFQFQDTILQSGFEEISKVIEPIKKAIHINFQKKENVRMIESNERRLVHFLFNPCVPSKVTPFTRKYLKLIDGSLADFEEQESQKFASYVHRMENEELEPDEVNPIVFE